MSTEYYWLIPPSKSREIQFPNCKYVITHERIPEEYLSIGTMAAGTFYWYQPIPEKIQSDTEPCVLDEYGIELTWPEFMELVGRCPQNFKYMEDPWGTVELNGDPWEETEEVR